MPKNQWRIEMSPQIPVTPKLVYQSKSFIGTVITVAGIVLPTLSQQSWISPEIAKLLANIGGFCQSGGPVLTMIGVIDRNDTFFRPSKMREAGQQAAANFTILEAAQTIEQGLKVATAPAAEKPGLAVDLIVDIQKRLSNQDAVLEAQNKELAEIRAATTANQFPDEPDIPFLASGRVDLPRDPRQRAQMEAPPVQGWEPDVLQANSEGVLEGY